ncbi:MAG: serine/threonine protein kinase [Deltaproteobacteria bacterium]|nr:serine/threonine protein kinase [Deltaproteobacteria bacterium]
MRPSILPTARVGSVVAERYQLVGQLGEGGQSAVYRALDLRDGDIVAIKILKPGTDSEATERMAREAQAMASLHGTAALRVLDQVWTADGAMGLVTEFLEGQTLDQLLVAVESTGRHLATPFVLSLLEPVALTLAEAHARAIVHRDLKPENIFVIAPERGGGVRLLDFGFARFQRLRSLTAGDQVAGSPRYISPETWLGRKDVTDHRVDIYALGAVVFRCFAGRAPFESNDLVTLLHAATRDPRPKLTSFRPDLPSAVDGWVELALAIDPAGRFQTTVALFRALQAALAG